MNQKTKTKSSSQVIVVSMMCTFLVTIVGQTVNVALNPSQYESVQAAGTEQQKVHGVADSSAKADTQTQFPVTDELNADVNKNKDKLNNRLKKMLGGSKGSNTSSEQLKVVEQSQGKVGFTYHKEDPHTHTEVEYELQHQRDYVPFKTLQTHLKETTCKYDLPVDNADPPLRTVIQWGLDHCLITVSASYKVYPQDYLTHKMMRVIAERAGFAVKMEYATDKIVTNSDLLSFLNALQQHHQISYIPSVPIGEKVKRGEYLTILYRLFTNDNAQDSGESQEISTPVDASLSLLPSQALSLGEEVINTYEQQNLNVPNELKHQLLEYANTILSDSTTTPTKDISGSIGFDTDALQATRVQIQQWLGRS